MSYITLYRKYRPQKFSEVIGQDISVKIITNSILKENFSHSYLFTGTRGTGKTTVARIFAKALNCLNRQGFEPCNACQNCISFNNGSFPDCIEIDAASNRGINEIKQIRENLKLNPIKGKFKIYIIDEVHMLTIEAFNALLKSLEEPPSFVVFILATTDIHKVPITIQSRCQKIEFKKVHHKIIFEHLKSICDKEKIVIDEDALMFLAKAANGSVRDSLSLLEQVRNISDNITLKDVLQMFSVVSLKWVYDYINFILRGDVVSFIDLINKVKFYSVNLYQFLYMIVNELKNCIYYKFVGPIDEFSSFQIENYKGISSYAKIEDLRKMMNSLNMMLNFYKSENDYILFEIYSLNLIFERGIQIDKKEEEKVEKEKKLEITETKENMDVKMRDSRDEEHDHTFDKNNEENIDFHKDIKSVKEKILKIFENDKLLYNAISNVEGVLVEEGKLVFIFQSNKKDVYVKILKNKSSTIVDRLKDLFDINSVEIRELKGQKITKSSKNSQFERIVDYTRRI